MKRLMKGILRFFIVLLIVTVLTALIVGIVFAIYVDRNIEKTMS